jgi:hypothetical protein
MKTWSIKSSARSMLADPRRAYHLPDNETDMTIPTNLVTVERLEKSTSQYRIILMTPRIAGIVADVQQKNDWTENWGLLSIIWQYMALR